MDKINLNEESFNANQFPEFNKGQAGVVQNLKMGVVKKLPDQEGNWDYRVDFTPIEGTGISMYFNYIKDDLDAESAGKQIRGQGITLKHMIHTMFGPIAFPDFNSPREMLDYCMMAIPKFTGLVRLAVCYGTKKAPTERIRVRRYAPFMENMDVEPQKLKLSSTDNLTPMVTEDTTSAATPPWAKTE